MGSATYRIGPSDFFTPGDLSADADTVQGQVDALDALLVQAAPPTDFQDQWTAWETQWRGFYSQHFGGFFTNLFSALNDSNRDDLIRYENQLAAFQQQAQGFGVSPIAPVGPSAGAQDNLASQLPKLGLPSTSTLIVLVVAGIVFLVVLKS